MPLKGLSFAFKFILITTEASIHCFEMLDFSLESGDFIISELLCDSSIIFKISKLLSSKELLVIHLGKSPLGLHVLVVDLFVVLNLSVQLLEICPDQVKLVILLADFDMNICQV